MRVQARGPKHSNVKKPRTSFGNTNTPTSNGPLRTSIPQGHTPTYSDPFNSGFSLEIRYSNQRSRNRGSSQWASRSRLPLLILPTEYPLASNADPRTYNYRYMFEKIMDRSEILDHRIDEMAQLLRNEYPQLIEELGDPADTSQDDVVIFGRIQLEWDQTSNSKLNENSLVLETSRLLGRGNRIGLRFEREVNVRGGAKGEGGVGFFPRYVGRGQGSQCRRWLLWCQ